MAEQLTPQAMTIEEIRQASAEDEELTHIRDNRQKNKPHKLPSQYKHVSEELCITDQNILLRGNRIVLPAKLRQRAISLAHEDHAGMTKCKQRIRSKMWWPQMDPQIEEHTKACHPCHVTSRLERPEPVCPTQLTKKPWIHLAIDVCGPFLTRESVVVLTDYYSRWPEVQILKSVTSANILAWLDEVFAIHGYPNQVWQCIILHLTRFPLYPKVMGCRTENRDRVLATSQTAKWNVSTNSS